MNPISTTIYVLTGMTLLFAGITVRNLRKTNRIADEATALAEKISELKAKMATA